MTPLAIGSRRRVIVALLLREAQTRFGKTRLGYLWALIEPISHVAVMSLVYWAINRMAPVGASVVLFFVTGVLPYFLFQKVALHLGGAVRSNQKLLRLPLVNTMNLVVSRAALEGLTWIVVSALIFFALITTGRAEPPEHPGACMVAAAAAFGLGCGVGLVNAVLMPIWPSWVQIYPTVTRPLYHFSAIFFFIDQIPSYLRDWLSWNPMVHAIQWFRQGYRDDYASTVLDEIYLLKWIAVTLLLGLCMERLAQRRLAEA